MNPAEQKNDLSNTQQNAIRKHLDIIHAELPGPEETWEFQDIALLSRHEHRKLLANDLLETVREAVDGRQPKLYRVPEPVDEYAETYAATRDLVAPCGHGGIQNNGDEYGCGFDPCEQTFSRSEIEQ